MTGHSIILIPSPLRSPSILFVVGISLMRPIFLHAGPKSLALAFSQRFGKRLRVESATILAKLCALCGRRAV
jgi:hypothetical protein